MPVKVEPYNPEWEARFINLKNQIWPHVSDLVFDVVHVGSTSVKGMSAKPIIDIDIVVSDMGDFDEIVRRLARIGYHHQGDLGITGREAFGLDYEHKYPHHLYLVTHDSTAYRNHILLKKHLSENPGSHKRYNDLKLRLAETSISMEAYWKSKTSLILEFLKAEGMSVEDIEVISEENE